MEKYITQSNIIAILLCLLTALSARAYNLTGKVIDETTASPLAGARVTALNDSSSILATTESGSNGEFAIENIVEPRILVEISHEGYIPQYMSVRGSADNIINQGTIALKKDSVVLNEVVVQGERIIQRPDRVVILPSAQEIARAATTLSLLNNLRIDMPGLEVNEEQQTITVDNRQPILKINGKPADINRVMGLNIENILRIEYFGNQDIRYNNYVINFVLKPRSEGGGIAANVESAVTTGFVNGNIGAAYNIGKSEWQVNYSVNHRNFKKRYVCSDGLFLGGDGTTSRIIDGLPSKFGYTTNYIGLGYTYMYSPKTMLAITLEASLHRQNVNDRTKTTIAYDSDRTTFHSLSDRKSDFKSPSIDIFFRKEFGGNNTIEANAYTNYNQGDYTRDYLDEYETEEPNYTITADTRGRAWGGGGEIMYSKGFSNLTVSAGVQDRFSSARNNYYEDRMFSLSKMLKNRVYFYGNVSGNAGKFGYMAGIGGLHLHVSDGTSRHNDMNIKAQAAMNYQIGRNLTLNYQFLYEPSSLALNDITEQIQQVDRIVVRKGTINLVPFKQFRNRIYGRFSKNKLMAMLSGEYSRIIDPVYTSYRYIDDRDSRFYGRFMQSPANGKYSDRFNVELTAGCNGLFNHVNIQARVGWNRYRLHTADEIFTDNNLYLSLFGSLYFGNFTLSANYEIKPQLSLWGNVMSRRERWNGVRAQYRWKDFRFSVTGVNLFTRRGSLYHNRMLSGVHPEDTYVYIKDCGNMVLLSVAYRLNFGKGYQKGRRSLERSSADTGIDNEY